MTQTVIDVRGVPPIGRDEAAQLAVTAYERLLDVLRALDPADWDRPTDCDRWSVKAIVAHLLGSAESHASLREGLHQARLAIPAARRSGRQQVDEINDVQVRERIGLHPAELIARLERTARPSIAHRMRVPRIVRRIPMTFAAAGRENVGYLLDQVLNRDVWLHRMDICRATGRRPVLTADHDGRILADVVGDWARRHCRPFTLRLSGPAGGVYSHGRGGEEHDIDAIEFARVLSGRAAGTGLLAIPHDF